MELRDEHKPPKRSLAEFLAEDIENRLGQPVRSEFRVEEWSPAYTDDDFYIGSSLTDKSEWFDTKEEAEELMAKMEPQYRHTLKVRRRTLYRKFVPAHWEQTWV